MSVSNTHTKGTQTVSNFVKEKQKSNKRIGIVLGIFVLMLMSVAVLMKG